MNALAAIFLALALLAAIFVLANIAIGYQGAKKRDSRSDRIRQWGQAMVHLNRSMRSRGLEPSLMDFRVVPSERIRFANPGNLHVVKDTAEGPWRAWA